MSNSRTNTSISDQTQEVVKATSACPDFNSEAVKDAKTYATTTMLTYIMGKLEYTYHTFGQSITPTAKDVAKKALQTKFKGLGFNISYNLLHSLTMLSVKDRVEKSLEYLNPGSALQSRISRLGAPLYAMSIGSSARLSENYDEHRRCLTK